MNESEVLNEPLVDAHNVRIRINCEFLHKCAFHCAGCFVNRNASNFDTKQLEILDKAVDMFRENGMTFDEIILGPTDFFAAHNTMELLEEPKFYKLFMNREPVVLTILTTLQSDEETILERISAVNDYFSNPKQEIEVLVVFDLQRVINEDQAYVDELQYKIRLLDRFIPAVDYALQMNIQDVSKLQGEFTLANITRFVKKHFNTIVEFNPSFLRTGKRKIVDGILDSWNSMLEDQIDKTNKDDITFTMSNPHHAGLNEITYNFHEGHLYTCPFIYENVFDKGSGFKIHKNFNDFYTWFDILNHEQRVKLDQFQYAEKTDECSTCPNYMSCVSKHVIFYMKEHELKKCMVSKPTIELYQC